MSSEHTEKLKASVEELKQRIDEYEAKGDDHSKKALVDYAHQTFTPTTQTWLNQQHGEGSVSDEHLSSLKSHFHDISEHLKDEEGQFDLAMAKLNNNAVFNFLERLFS